MKKSFILFLALLGMIVACFFVTSTEAHPTADTISFYRARFFPPDENSRGPVRAIAQTTDGYLWVGTENGLVRFDGHQFERMPLSNANDAPSEPVNSMAADTKGGLWVSTRNGLFHCKEGECSSQELPPDAHRNILSLAPMADSTLWMGTQTGFLRRSDDGLIQVSHEGLVFSVRSLITDDMGYLWAGAGGNLLRLTPSDPDETVIYNFRSLRLDFIRSVCRRHDGSLWLGSNSGLVRFAKGECTLFTKTNGLPDNTVASVFEDSRGNLWIGTYGGLCRLVDGKFEVQTTAEGEPYNLVNCFFEDREGNLWVGTKDGLYQLALQQFSTLTTRQGLAHNNVISVYEDTRTNLWIGTWGGGLHHLQNGKLSIYASANTSMANDLVLALHASRDGALWFSQDYDGGLYRFSHGKFQHFNEKAGLPRNAIRAIMEDRTGRLWLARSTAYLAALQDGKFETYDHRHGLPTNAIRSLLETHDGAIFAGTTAGLCVWTNGGFLTLTASNALPDNTVFSLHEDAEQTLWIGTGKGLGRMEQLKTNETPHVSHFTFFEDAILEILEDDFQNLWLATRNGVLRVARSELAKQAADPNYKVLFIQFGRADGMASEICVGVAKPSAFKTKDGRLWFATTKGLAVTDPKLQIAKNEKPPFVVIREVLADKQKVEDGKWRIENGTVAERPSPSTILHLPSSPLLLPAGRGELEVHYTALSYTAPEKNRFKYKLEGLDRDWIDAGARREAFYNNVPPGDYTFRVIACNNDGIWNSLGSSVKLSLRPHLWQTLWFKSFAILSILVFVSLLVRYATRKRLQLKLERLEQQHAIEKERTRIAQDMHDDLGARLTEILMLSNLTASGRGGETQMKTHAEKVVGATEDLVRNLDGIVWAVNPQNDSLSNLALYFYEYTQRFLGASNIRYRWEAPEELPSLPLTAEVRHSVFLAFKEALNNAARHSNANEIQLRLHFADSTLSIAIEDDGKGFSDHSNASSGNGLLNMRKRMESIGGQFTFRSEAGKGTRVELKVPLHR